MSLGVTSGVVTQASGWAPTGRTLNLEPLPVHIIGSGDQSPVNSFAGPDGNRALNVNISGGSIAVNISGQPVSVSGQPVIALSGGVLPVSLVSGTITVLSGVTVVISGVTAEISGDVVNISGQTVQIVSGAVGFYQPSPATLASGATTPLLVDSIGRPAVRIDTFTVMAPVDIQAKLSGIYIVSGEAVYVSTSGATVAVASGGTLPVTGGVVVSGSVQVSGTVAVSNTGFQVSGAVAVSGTVGVSNFPAGFVVSGGITVSGGVTVSGVVGISGGAAGLSGLIVEISGQAVTTTVNPFGYQSGTLVGVSGGQLALSGLNVVFSGQAVSVSGDTLVVATSGYITLDVVYQNSGTAGSGLLGVAPMGLQGTQFFPLTANSGSLNVNISGGSIATTPPAYQSGTLVVLSGGTAGLSGLVVTDSGSVVNLGSGIISTSGIANVVIAGSGGTAPAVGTAGADGVPTAAPGMLTKGELYGFNGSNFDRVRTTQGAAGTGIGILAAGLFWQYALVSGAVLSNVQSGASVLHTVTINAWVSGGQIKVMDSLSGNTGSPIAQIAYTEVGSLATNAFIPLTLDYDCIANSGIVVITSGTGMNVTIAFRSPI